MAAITNDWLGPLSSEFKKPYYKELYKTVKHEYETKRVFPEPDIFNAFAFTPLADVKVVILGQDPYHNYGQAHGLCFSVKPDVDIPPSLVNIYQELHDDLGCYIPNNGYLKKWADQGVMLLNNPRHLILEAPHPSPLSASRGFFGSRPFSKTNAFLTEHGLTPVDWQIENI